MNPAAMMLTEAANKRRMIAELSRDEIPGYEAVAKARGWLDGEAAALAERMKEVAR